MCDWGRQFNIQFLFTKSNKSLAHGDGDGDGDDMFVCAPFPGARKTTDPTVKENNQESQ